MTADARSKRRVKKPARPLTDDAFQGFAGEIVRKIEPHSEADPAAILTQFLGAFGNAVGAALDSALRQVVITATYSSASWARQQRLAREAHSGRRCTSSSRPTRTGQPESRAVHRPGRG